MRHMESIRDQLASADPSGYSPAQTRILSALKSFFAAIEKARESPGNMQAAILSTGIYELLSNKDLRAGFDMLKNDPSYPKKDLLSLSLLPTKDEFSGGAFRNVFFNYVRKADDIPNLNKKRKGEKVAE